MLDLISALKQSALLDGKVTAKNLLLRSVFPLVVRCGGTAPDGADKMLGDYSVGETVFLNLGGVATEFLIVHQGNPDASLYSGNANGTWLIPVSAIGAIQWDSAGTNDYGASSVHTYLNNDFISMLDTDVQSVVQELKIPYCNSNAVDGEIASGEDGLLTKAFLLSGTEVGWTKESFGGSAQYLPDEGTKLDYFVAGLGDDAKPVRRAMLNGSYCDWWVRTVPCKYNKTLVLRVAASGAWGSNNASSTDSLRPAIVLPFNAKFNGNNEFVSV